jgi:arsenite methyltransferase
MSLRQYAGALKDSEYDSKLRAAGFESVDIEPARVYTIDNARQFLTAQRIDVDAIAPAIDGKFKSALIRALKPSE